MDIQNQTMGYDRTATMFSPEGHLLQVEYAEKTVRLGSASIGMVCSDGVFILADKRNEDKLVVKEYANKIYEIDSHVIASVAGIIADARVLVEKAQVLAQQHRITYDSEIEPELIIKDISTIKQQFTQYGGARPFGVSLMVVGVNKDKGELYTSDITGNYSSYHANAIGENDDKIRDILKEKYSEDFALKRGVKVALEIFKEVKGDKFDESKFELVFIENKDKKLKRKEGTELKNYIH